MWGRIYWGRNEGDGRKAEGIVVLFAWLSSQEKHLKPYVDLYRSIGWGCLICHVDFLTLFFPEKAATLARGVLNELIKEVKFMPLPIVLAAFSGGSKGCLYKFLQVVDGKCEGQLNLQDDYQLVRLCLSGQMFDSSPVDFISDLGTKFVLQPSVLRLSHPPRVVTWMAKAFASSLDALFKNRFETERAEYWETLYSSVSMGPFLVLCSEDDELASYKTVCGFAQHLKELGGDVKLMIWSSSPHVAHYRYHKAEYKAAVTELLAKASLRYSRKLQLRRASEEQMLDSTSSHGATVGSGESPRSAVAIDTTHHFFLQNSLETDEAMDAGPWIYENKEELSRFQNIGFQGVQSPCVLKSIEDADTKSIWRLKISSTDVEDWDIKCIKRSRL